MDEAAELLVFEKENSEILKRFIDIVIARNLLEEQEKVLRAKIREAMEKVHIRKYTGKIADIAYIAESSAEVVNSETLKQKYPDIFNECSREQKRAAYVRVSLKDYINS